MLSKLIVNADDFGLTAGVNLGIAYAFKNGIVTSTTLMVNMPYTLHAVEIANELEDLAVGIHLTATVGGPLLGRKNSLTDENGKFHKITDLHFKKVKYDEAELYEEWKAQIEYYIKIMGKKPSHIDSHHHIHTLKDYKAVAKRLGEEYDLPVRQIEEGISKYQFVEMKGNFYEDEVSTDYFTEDKGEILKREYTEIMCHPAYVDVDLQTISSYAENRNKELSVLTSGKVKQWIEENNIELINFNNLKKC